MLRLTHLRPDLYEVLDAAQDELETHASYICTTARQARGESTNAPPLQVYLRLQHSLSGCLLTMEDLHVMMNLSSVANPVLITVQGQVVKLSSVYRTHRAQLHRCKACRCVSIAFIVCSKINQHGLSAHAGLCACTVIEAHKGEDVIPVHHMQLFASTVSQEWLTVQEDHSSGSWASEHQRLVMPMWGCAIPSVK